ncbi:MAG: glycosyltransferase [Bacteroidia bacterium]|nr:glycosyltransferase [Bacteroidia bacterium]
MKRIIISVTTDLVTDQRVHRAALTLHEEGYNVTVVGRRRNTSLPLSTQVYRTKRMHLFFERGPLFYFWFNIRLFFFLLFSKADILYSNDLDTLLPNFIAAKLKRCKLYYDCHEYFTAMPELKGRPVVRMIWKTIEWLIFPRLKNIITVNFSLAKVYGDEYRKKVSVVRNLPMTDNKNLPSKTKKDFQLPDKKLIVFQGAGINVDRGAEEAFAAMQFVSGAVLAFVGDGDVVPKLKKMTADLNMSDKVFFVDKLPPDKLRQLTRLADIGLSIDKDTNINYRFSLPNKLFDYIHAGVPVLASPLPEVAAVVAGYDIGILISEHSAKHIAARITTMLSDEGQIKKWKENLAIAAQELCWEKEKMRFLYLFQYG